MFHVGAKFALLRLIFCLRQKIRHPPAPLLLLCRKKSRSACLLGCKHPHNGLAVATNFLRVARVQLPSPKSRKHLFYSPFTVQSRQLIYSLSVLLLFQEISTVTRTLVFLVLNLSNILFNAFADQLINNFYYLCTLNTYENI